MIVVSEGQDPLHATLLVATLSRLMLSVAKELFPQRAYFDLVSTEKQTVADSVQTLLLEAQTILSGPDLLLPRRGISLPLQRDEEYL
ncbi:MAG: hypothetical protein ACREJP_04695 [Candidatus Methylomirabilales bacterium]